MSGLGRIYVPNDGPHASQLMSNHPALTAALPSSFPRKQLWTPGPVLDQGATPRCTAFCARDHLNAEPHAHPDLGPTNMDDFYAQEKAIDGLPPGTEGSTMAAMVSIMEKYGVVEPPYWAFEELSVRRWILTQSPVCLGTNWYDAMDRPDAANIVHIYDTPVRGGHAYLAMGYDEDAFGLLPPGNPLYKLQNSWGATWGEDGFFYMGVGDMARLLAENGEAVAVLNWLGMLVTPSPALPTSMWDAVEWQTIPADVPLVAGYVNGFQSQWPARAWNRFTNATRKFRIDVRGDMPLDSDVLDIEAGNAQPADAPGWIDTRERADITTHRIYADRSTMPKIVAACGGRSFKRWIADWTGIPHQAAGADATQWANPQYGSGGNFDVSLVAPSFLEDN